MVDPSFCLRQFPDSLNPDPFVGDVGGDRSENSSGLVGDFEKNETDDAARTLGFAGRVVMGGTLSCNFGASVVVVVGDTIGSLGDSGVVVDVGLARLFAARVEDPICSLSTASLTDPG